MVRWPARVVQGSHGQRRCPSHQIHPPYSPKPNLVKTGPGTRHLVMGPPDLDHLPRELRLRLRRGCSAQGAVDQEEKCRRPDSKLLASEQRDYDSGVARLHL